MTPNHDTTVHRFRVTSASAHVVHLVCLLVLAVAMFFTRLGAPLLEPEEARYAEIPRQMLAENRWLLPVLHGEPYYHKPPLVYWLVMSCYRVFGVHDWAARLLPGVTGVLLVLLVYRWGRHVVGEQAAFLGGLILCLSARFIYLARCLTIDGVLALFVTAALLAAYRGLTQGRRWWAVSAVCCGLAILTKGPVALVLVVVPVLLFTWLDRLQRLWNGVGVPASTGHVAANRLQPGLQLTVWGWLGYLALAAAIGAPWYMALALLDWDGFVTFFWQHNVLRYVAPLDHIQPLWFYLPVMFEGLFPWSLLLISLVWHMVQRLRTVTHSGAMPTARRGHVSRCPGQAEEKAPNAVSFLLIACGWCLLFYSCAGCKRSVYILPALPLLALALGCYLAQAVQWVPSPWRHITSLQLPARGAGLALVAALGLLFFGMGVSVVVVTAGLWSANRGLLAVAVLAGVAAVVSCYRRRLSTPAAWLSCMLLLAGLQVAAICCLLPDYHRRISLRGQIQRHAAWCHTEKLPVVCYPRVLDSVTFYLQAEKVRTYTSTDLTAMISDLERTPGALVVIKADIAPFLHALPPSLEFIPCGRQSKSLHVGVVQPRSSWALARP